jgi:Ca-activated chloride channel homolog
LSLWPEFHQPAWLVLLTAVPVAGIWYLRRKPAALRFSDVQTAAAANNRRGATARWTGALGRCLALAAVVVALAGPRWPDLGSRLPTEGIAILLVFDLSNSMNETDFIWQGKPISRLAAVKQAFRLFVRGGAGPSGDVLAGRPQDLIGLVTFTRKPKSSCPLTLSHDALLDVLEREETNKGGHDFDTNIGDAIAWALYRFQGAPVKQRTIVLVTDGEQGEIGGALRPREAAQLAANFGVPIFAIDAGNDNSTPRKDDGGGDGQAAAAAKKFSAENRINAKKAMQDVARLTHGQYYHAGDDAALLEVCGKLQAELDKLEPERIESFVYSHYWEGYAWFGGAAFALWALLAALELTVWRVLP